MTVAVTRPTPATMAAPTTRRVAPVPWASRIARPASATAPATIGKMGRRASTVRRRSWRYTSPITRRSERKRCRAPGGGSGGARSGSATVGLPERRRLRVEELAVPPPPRHEDVVRALLDQVAVLEHDDAVGVADRGEAVRDEQRRHGPLG